MAAVTQVRILVTAGAEHFFVTTPLHPNFDVQAKSLTPT